MPDLRERLTRLSDRTEVSPDSWNRFVTARRRHEVRRRVVAVAVSLVVACAGLVGVWGAFRPRPATHGPNPSTSVASAPFLSLWPQRSIELGPALMPDIGSAQRRADSGSPGTTWQLSPTEVAKRFATQVLGWPQVAVASMQRDPDGSVIVTVGNDAASCFGSNDPSPVDCPLVMGHVITLVEPGVTGPRGIWEVVEVHPVTSQEFDLGVGRGQTLTTGQTLRFNFADVPPGTIGLTAFYDCGSPRLQVNGTIHVDPNNSTGVLQIPQDISLSGMGCISGTPNGYIYAYSVAPPGTGVGDPFKASSEIGEIAIVPVVLKLTHSTSPSRAVAVPTCAPNGAPWVSASCPESSWVRRLVAASHGRILGVTDGIEPQHGDAFLVELDGVRFSLGAISRRDFHKMGGYWSMGEFGAGMADAGTVSGVPLFGDHSLGHWSWQVHGFTIEVYPASHSPRHVSRGLAARLVATSRSVREPGHLG